MIIVWKIFFHFNIFCGQPDFDASRGWTIVLFLNEPLTQGTFYGTNTGGWSVNAAGDLISFTSLPHNRDLLEFVEDEDWGNERFYYKALFRGFCVIIGDPLI